MSNKVARPFFSIVIPTKNRSNILIDTLLSIKNQTYDSYELIVVDNDDGDETYKVCTSIPNEKMRYLKTGSLNMFDNWNYAISNAIGEWVIVLEDKQALYKNSLEVLYKAIVDNQIKTALCFQGDYYDDTLNETFGFVRPHSNTGHITFKISNQIIDDYEQSLVTEKSGYDVVSYIPRPNTSVVSYDLLQKTKEKFGQYCSFGALDFTSGLKKLLLSDVIYRIDTSIYLVTTLKQSNGLYSAIYREEAHARDIKIADEIYKKELENLPFKELSMFTVFLLDYITIRKKNNSKFIFKYNKSDYIYRIFKDIYNIHAVKRNVNLINSTNKFIRVFHQMELGKLNKIFIFFRILKHVIFVNSIIFILFLKKPINKIFLKFGPQYKSPIEYINSRG